jgi:Flp pilus assembly pilin Flp
MNFFKNMIELFRDDESGAATVEYIALAIAVTALGAVAFTLLEGVVSGATVTL